MCVYICMLAQKSEHGYFPYFNTGIKAFLLFII